jgi:hypothetical protein
MMFWHGRSIIRRQCLDRQDEVDDDVQHQDEGSPPQSRSICMGIAPLINATTTQSSRRLFVVANSRRDDGRSGGEEPEQDTVSPKSRSRAARSLVCRLEQRQVGVTI